MFRQRSLWSRVPRAALTLAAAVTATLSAAPVPYITSTTPSSLRTNFGGNVGFKFIVGSTAITVSSLGRFCVAGNAGTHTVKLVKVSDGTDAASVPVSMAGCTPGQFKYATISNLILQANSSYYLVSGETINGDQWYDYEPVTTTSAASLIGPTYFDGLSWVVVEPTSRSYVPVNFLYTPINDNNAPIVVMTAPSNNATVSGTIAVKAFATDTAGSGVAGIQFILDGIDYGAPVTIGSLGTYTFNLNTTTISNGVHTLSGRAFDKVNNSFTAQAITVTVNNANPPPGTGFVTSFNPTTLRNNFAGSVGIAFTTGASALRITSLGRMCVGGNAQAHTVKLAFAPTSLDVPGTTVSVSTAGCTPGTFVYQALASPVTLAQNASYFLVSQETSGGDFWWDVSQVFFNSTYANVTGPVFSSTPGQYVSYALPGQSYLPVDFQFSLVAADVIPPSVLLTSPAPGATLTPNSGATITALASDDVGVVGVQFFVDNIPYGFEQIQAPYTLSLILLPGNHTLTARARDAAGNKTTSAPAQVTWYDPNPLGLFPQMLSSFTLTSLRNNFTGSLGMKFTTTSARNVNGVGRLCVAGNSQVHTVKVVNPRDGSTVLSGDVNMAGCFPGVMTYALISQVSLPAGTYYLVSQETSDGDQWYDVGPVASSKANVLFPVYSQGTGYVELASNALTNTSYVPVDLAMQ